MQLRTLLLPLASVVALVAPMAHAATLNVTSALDTGGTCPSVASCTLRQAITDAQDGDTIQVPADLGGFTDIVLAGSELIITHSISIVGTHVGSSLPRVRAGFLSRDFHVTNNATVTLQDLFFGQAYAGSSNQSVFGGCVLGDAGTTLVLRHVNINNCIAQGGTGAAGVGGAGAQGGSSYGAGVAALGGLEVYDSTITGVTAYGGTGGDGAAGFAGGRGGDARGAALYTTRSLIVRNSSIGTAAAYGGAGGKGSSANGGDGGRAQGGAIAIESSSTALVSAIDFVTFVEQSVGGGNGGMGTPAGAIGAVNGVDLYVANSTVMLKNSVLQQSTASADAGCALGALGQLSGANLAYNITCGGAASAMAPLVGSLNGFYGPISVFPVSPGGAAQDAVTDCTFSNGAPNPRDERGESRPQIFTDGLPMLCDAGAFELSPRLFVDGFE